MSWSERQRAVLEAMGLGQWPGPLVQAEAAGPVVRGPQDAPPSRGLVEATPADDAPPAASVANEGTTDEMATDVMTTTATAGTSTAEALAAACPDLAAVHAAVQACTACGLCRGRHQAVPGVGHPQAHWMVVGEAPGEQEDLQGEPFVGPSGRLLDAMLAAVGRTRQASDAERQVFIANTLKCRPPGNRNPSPEELAACAPFLQRQLALVRPRVVLALGRFAAQSLLATDEPIGRLRGRVHHLADGTPVVVSYHPSYLLRQPLEKAKAWSDLCLAADLDEPLRTA